MLGGIFNKRKKNQELRLPSLQDIKKFRDSYAKYAELRQVETPPCFEKSIYKAIAGQKELHTIEFKQEDVTDPQMFALAEALLEMPIVSSLDLRDNRITDDGVKALLEVLRLQIIAAKTPPTIDPRTKQPLYPPLPEYTRYVTNVLLKGNEVSASVLQELSQYMEILRREDKRLEIRAALNHIDRSNDGRIDEEEFKGVLKLLTASTPTKKEIRAFMQQHTLSTDTTQNEINLENVLLAKCATSPSRHSACPPWEALVQQRHAILGASRMAPKVILPTPESPDPASTKARLSRLSLLSSGDDKVTGGVDPFIDTNNLSDVSPIASPSSQIAAVAPIEKVNAVTKSPPAPVVNAPVPPQHPQTAKLSESALPDQLTKPPSIPILPLASVSQHPVSSRPHSARSSVDDEGQRNPALARDTGPNYSTPAPSPSHDSDKSDSVSIVSPAFGGSVSQRNFEDHDHTKAHVAPTIHSVSTKLDLPRRQSEHFSAEDDEETSAAGVNASREDAPDLSAGDADGDVRSTLSHRTSKSVASSNEFSDSKSVSGLSRREVSLSGNETQRELLAKGSEIFSTGHDEKRSPPGSAVSTPRMDDLSSLGCHGAEEGDRSPTSANNCKKGNFPPDQPEEDEGVEEHVDSLMFNVTKDGKERSVVKLIHSEFRSGLSVKDFPASISFRNLLALLLPDNGLSDLALFVECRFPFTTVLDLSRNKLVKLADEGLAAFPRLEVLNVADNQLKSISGLSKTFKLRALGLSNNAIRSVTNVEHLLQLEILELANNQIANVHALRLLSLNKVLAHLNLDGNPVVETDERQKRKNIVHIRNLLPILQSLGSVPCPGLHSKDKKKTNSSENPGKCLFDNDEIPDFKAMWVSTACDTLHILQDAMSQSSSQSQHDDDEWDTRDEDGGEDRPRKPLTREQQRQRDELRSRAIGFRTRGKAIPSPPKIKTSAFCFGPPQPPPIKKKKKKPAPADPSVVREQQRRAIQLSAPKYTPVDKTLMQQEQKRKSRVDFHNAMTVGERIQLTQELSQRRPTALVGLSARSRSILAKADSRKRASGASTTTITEETTEPDDDAKAALVSPSPQRLSPTKDAMVFRIDDAPRSPKGVLTFRVDPYPAGLGQSSPPKTNELKESGFLHDLAVSDFLNHAEEEFSTAMTALNVLLSMSEKENGDCKKLAEFRTRLEALEILNEHESHELFNKAQDHPDSVRQAQCTEWFTKLGAVKKCMRQLLEKLEGHAPGSGVIRAYCRYIRSNELHGIITTMEETDAGVHDQYNATAEIDAITKKVDASPTSTQDDTVSEKANHTESPTGSTPSHLFDDTSMLSRADDSTLHALDTETTHIAGETHNFSAGDDDLDFLESNDTVFGDGKVEETLNDARSASMDDTTDTLDIEDQTSNSDPALLTATTDITLDIQMDDSVSTNNYTEHADESHEEEDLVKDVKSETNEIASAVTEDKNAIEVHDEVHIEEPLETYECESRDQAILDEPEDESGTVPTSTEDAAPENEDYDWLATSTDLETGTLENTATTEATEADSFEQEMAAVSEDEGASDGIQEQNTEGEDLDWSTTETAEPTIEEGTEINEEVCDGQTYNSGAIEGEAVSEEVYDDQTYETEETIDGEAVFEDGVTYEVDETNEGGNSEEHGDYNEDTEIATEETELTDAQYEIGEGVDADDEEAETFGDWEKGFDPNSNHYFWFNHSTGESSWTPPEGWPHEVDEPFSTEAQEYEEAGTEGQVYDEAATEGQYYEEGTEGQVYEEPTDGTHYDEEGAIEGQDCEEDTAESQHYEEGAAEGQYYEEGAEGQVYEEEAAEDHQYYEETPAEGEAYVESPAEQQQYDEATANDQWYDETATEGQDYAAEAQNYEVTADEEQEVGHTGDESPRRSEVSDIEFDDSDLPI